jgi:hypothetical protein
VSLVASSFPLFNFLQQQLSSSSSSSLRPRFDDGGPLNVISSFVISRWPKICSGGLRGGGRSERDDKLMEEVVESRGRKGSYIDKTRNRQAPLPPPTAPLVPLQRLGLHFGCKTVQNHTSPFNYAGRWRGRGNDVGATRQGQQPNCGAFLISIYCFRWSSRLFLFPNPVAFNFNPRRLSIPTSSSFNFQTPSLFYFLPFSLMVAVCLMLLLPDDLIT